MNVETLDGFLAALICGYCQRLQRIRAFRPLFLETAAAEEAFVGCGLFYVGGFALLSGVGMMFMFHRFVFRRGV